MTNTPTEDILARRPGESRETYLARLDASNKEASARLEEKREDDERTGHTVNERVRRSEELRAMGIVDGT